MMKVNGTKSHHSHNGGTKRVFRDYWTLEHVMHAFAINRPGVIRGTFRINQRNYEEAYITNPIGDNDILVYGMHDRNRAFHGDVVVVHLKPRAFWIVRETAYNAWKKAKAAQNPNGHHVSVKPVVVLLDSSNDNSEACGDRRSDDHLHKVHNHYNRDEMVCIWQQMQRTAAVRAQQQLDSGIEERIAELSLQRPQDTEHLQPTHSANCAQQVAFEKAPQPKHENIDPPPAQPVRGNNRREYRYVKDFPDENIPSEFLQHTGEVVHILEAKNTRRAVGRIRPTSDGKKTYAFFVPNDSRVPRMLIPAACVDPKFFSRPQDYEKFLYIAHVKEWNSRHIFPMGELQQALGLAGEIESETEGLLIQYGIDTREFCQTVLDCLPHITENESWKIPEEELKKRMDLRNETVFTIDPMTARDLDDALHVKDLGNDVYEIGVHIADVSYFVQENSALDQWAAQRCTSTYLVHKVIPMLPRLLCEELCSLNAGVDRLTFSVIWKLRASNAEILSEWMGRTVIRSSCKMSYEHAQGFLDEPNRAWTREELPEIHNGREPEELCANVNMLWRVAKVLKVKRRAGGSLRIDMPKLQFSLDPETQMPQGCCQFKAKPANNLIEEFMLLANMRIAETVAKRFPELALLRRHPPPDPKRLQEVIKICEALGFPLDGATSAALQRTLDHYNMDPEKKDTVCHILNQLLMKPMQLAVYFCTGMLNDVDAWRHFALAVPFYTHFTSPIRRYADIMVHRLLAAHLGYVPLPRLLSEEVQRQAEECNDRKLNSKLVSEASSEMFFALFVKQCGPIEERGLVMNVLDHSFDVLLVQYGTVKRVYCDQLSIVSWIWDDGYPPTLTLTWPKAESSNDRINQSIRVTNEVQCVLSAIDEQPLQYRVTIQPPEGAKGIETAYGKSNSKDK